jgi:hypothetical protein
MAAQPIGPNKNQSKRSTAALMNLPPGMLCNAVKQFNVTDVTD